MYKFGLSIDRGTPTVITGISREQVTKQYKTLYPDSHISVKKLIETARGTTLQVPNYISNSAFQKYWKDPEAYCIEYCLFNPPSRFAQTAPMMYGSAFDGYIKNYLYDKLYDKMHPDFDLPKIIHDQCEPQFWDPNYEEEINGHLIKYNPDLDAFKWGEHLFNQYKKSGTLNDLMRVLDNASELPRFEFTVENSFKDMKLGCESDPDFILLGKPDLYFKTKEDEHIILDFKCNSIATARNTSPKKGYIMSRDGWDYLKNGRKQSRSNGKTHKDAMVVRYSGIPCNISEDFEDIEPSWADQTTAYSWLMGTPVGGKAVVGIHQICGQKLEGIAMPDVLIAQHHYLMSPNFQKKLYMKYTKMWKNLQTGHIFHDLSREESDKKVAQLNSLFGVKHEKGSNEEWLANSLRTQTYYG